MALHDTLICSIEDCGRPYWARAYCNKHYKNFHRHGNPRHHRMTVDERFEKYVRRSPNCWEWAGPKSMYGYARFGGKPMLAAHRYAYEQVKGPIPEGLQIDHLCRNHGCVNPDHLEAVTNQVNSLRGVGPSAQNARKTHCKRGHEFSPANTHRYRGQRLCRLCGREKTRRWRAAHPRLP